MKDKFYILSVDGGGFRGAYSAYLLKRLEDEWAINWRSQFDMFAGTSTGSIIAAGLACGLTANDLFNLYAWHGKAIFKRRWFSKYDLFSLSGLFASRYSNKKLKEILFQQIGKTCLGDVTVPLIIPSVDIGSGQVHVFKSGYDKGFVRDAKVMVANAVLASCAAPTYFDPYTVEPYSLVDGGLWANNPSMVSVIDAKRRLGVNLDDIRILSIGTGKSKKYYPRKSRWFTDTFLNSWFGWGFATRWGSSKFIDILLNLQADTAQNMLRLLFQKDNSEPEQLLRINFESDRPLPMDSPFKLDDWKRQADRDFTYNSNAMKTFLNI